MLDPRRSTRSCREAAVSTRLHRPTSDHDADARPRALVKASASSTDRLLPDGRAEDGKGLAKSILTLSSTPVGTRQTMEPTRRLGLRSRYQFQSRIVGGVQLALTPVTWSDCKSRSSKPEWKPAVTKNRTLILGASGMLGSAVLRAFHGAPDQTVVATVRNASSLKHFSTEQRADIMTNVDVLDGDALVSLLNRTRPETIINCVGLIKQLSSAKDPLVALPLNALFPHRLARLAALSGTRLVHISTDCVFAGTIGNYTEKDRADATDLYGMSKYLGEVVDYDNAVTIRTSIIGRELSSSNSLVDWFLAQENEVKGYDKAIFSGLPTCELAEVIRDVVVPARGLKGLYHVSAKAISKYELLRLIAAAYKKDITIVRDDRISIDRSLDSTRFSTASGYTAPDWPELIRRMHDTDSRGDE